jgi:hypothetical protein
MTENTFTCEACGGTFEKAWTDEEAAAERAANGWTGTDCGLTCHDCYLKTMERRATDAQALSMTPKQLDVLVDAFGPPLQAPYESTELLESWAAILQVPVKYLTKSREDL